MGVERTANGWRVRWTDPTGLRQCKGGFTRKADADAYHKRLLGDIARGDYVDPRAGRQTLAAWADDWLAGARNLSAGGLDTYRRDLDRHILPALGRLPVGKLSATNIDRYLNDLALAPSTVHRHYRTIHRMMEVARQRGLVARNPAEFVEAPTVPRVERPVLDPLQVDALADAITPRYRAWVYVMCYGALRWSEAVGLRRKSVSTPGGGFLDPSPDHHAQRSDDTPSEQADGLHTNHQGAGGRHARTLNPALPTVTRASPRSAADATMTIHVVEQLIHRSRGVWERVEPKAGSRRTVTLPTFAAAELAAHLNAYSLAGPEGLVFPTCNGTPVQSPSFTANVFKRALRKAGLPDVRIHDLRHTAVSLAIDAGANVKANQARSGHASSALHLDRYGHAYPAADAAVAAGLEELRAKALRGRLRAV